MSYISDSKLINTELIYRAHVCRNFAISAPLSDTQLGDPDDAVLSGPSQKLMQTHLVTTTINSLYEIYLKMAQTCCDRDRIT